MKYVISDIHGCYEEFMELLEKISFSEQDELFVLGDVLDRGPEPIKTMQEIMGRKNVTFLLGNHEYMFALMLQLLDDEDMDFEEKNNLLKYINDKDYIVTLEIEGKQMDSIEFSEAIDKTLINYPNITFIIGGSYGIHNDIKNKSNLKLSFSKMTFPHQLFRIILLEQIYRGFKIMKNESYHK